MSRLIRISLMVVVILASMLITNEKAGAVTFTDFGWFQAAHGFGHVYRYDYCADPQAVKEVVIDYSDGVNVYPQIYRYSVPCWNNILAIWPGDGNGFPLHVWTTWLGCHFDYPDVINNLNKGCGVTVGIPNSQQYSHCKYVRSSAYIGCLELKGWENFNTNVVTVADEAVWESDHYQYYRGAILWG